MVKGNLGSLQSRVADLEYKIIELEKQLALVESTFGPQEHALISLAKEQAKLAPGAEIYLKTDRTNPMMVGGKPIKEKNNGRFNSRKRR